MDLLRLSQEIWLYWILNSESEQSIYRHKIKYCIPPFRGGFLYEYYNAVFAECSI